MAEDGGTLVRRGQDDCDREDLHFCTEKTGDEMTERKRGKIQELGTA